MSFELRPHKLVYGGKALAHAQGQTFLVTGALPGETALVETVGVVKGVVRARAVQILIPAANRVQPPCPYFNTCGGCHYQHLAYPDQVRWKVEIVRETLRHIGKIPWDRPIKIHQDEPWHCRNQGELKVERTDSADVAIGFFQAESHHLVSIERCKILSPLLNRTLEQLNQPAWRRRLGDYREVSLLADDQDSRVRILLRADRHTNEAKLLAEDLLRGIERVSGVVIEAGPERLVAGDDAVLYQVGSFRYRISAGAFFQASRFLISDLIMAVTDGEKGLVALDLYAGVGLFSLPLARTFREVLAVESQKVSASDLAWNAQAAGLDNLTISNQRVEDFLRRYARREPDLVVLDPPRTGAGPGVLRPLATLRPRRICYVSCHPPTLARDLCFVVRQGYQLESVELFDFFPQTYHVECVARLARSAG